MMPFGAPRVPFVPADVSIALPNVPDRLARAPFVDLAPAFDGAEHPNGLGAMACAVPRVSSGFIRGRGIAARGAARAPSRHERTKCAAVRASPPGVWSTSDTVRSPSHAVRATRDTVRSSSHAVHSPSDAVHSPSDAVHTTRDVVHSPSDAVKSTGDTVAQTSDAVQSTSDVIHLPNGGHRSTSGSVQPTDGPFARRGQRYATPQVLRTSLTLA